MKQNWYKIVAICCLAFVSLQCAQQQEEAPPQDTAADEAAIRDINESWFEAYQAGDADAIVALYADDAVLSAPGMPALRGKKAIREYLVKDVAEGAGLSFMVDSPTDVSVSCDLAWEFGTYTGTDESGATVDQSKYLTVFEKRDGKWVIVRDMWNADGPAQMSEAM